MNRPRQRLLLASLFAFLLSALLQHSVVCDAATTSLVSRSSATKLQQVVDLGTWSGKALRERYIALSSGAGVLPLAASQLSLVTNLKAQVQGVFPSYLNHTQANSGSFDAWFAAQSQSALPYWVDTDEFLQGSQNPSNFFAVTPRDGLSTNMLGWPGIAHALDALRWTGSIALPYQAEQKIATGNTNAGQGTSCSYAYADNEARWNSASYVSEDDFWDGVFYGIAAVSWSEPSYYDIACSRKRANAIVTGISGQLAHSADLYLRGGPSWWTDYGPLYLRGHQFYIGPAVTEATCPDGGGYTVDTYKYFGSLTAAMATQRVFNTKSLSSGTWPYAVLNWTCPLPANYPDADAKSFSIGEAVVALKWDVSGGFQFVDNAPIP